MGHTLGARVAAAVLCATMAGCALQRVYTGPSRPPDEVALVLTNPAQQLQLESVDGAGVSSGDRFELLPGHHALRLRLLRGDGSASRSLDRATVSLEAEPGHTYRLRGVEDPVTGRWTGQIEDAGPLDPAQASVRADALERSCRGGKVEDCAPAGARYERGDRQVGWDEARAAELYDRACQAGKVDGCFRLAVLTADGHGVPRDENQAAGMFRSLCEAGDLRACTRLAELVEGGRGAKRDDLRALRLYEQSCDSGDGAACYRLGARAREGVGDQADYARAAALYEKGCTLGEADACTGLALLVEDGLGVEPDEARAAELYDRACARGSPLGCANLGVLYQLGLGVGRDERRAVALFRKGCAKGAASACAALEGLNAEAAVAARPPEEPPPEEPEPPAPTASAGPCLEYTPTGSHLPVRVCPEAAPPAARRPRPNPPVASAPPADASWSWLDWLQVGVRGEGDLLQRGLVPAVSVEWGDRIAIAATVIVRLSPGYRLEARGRPFQFGPVQPYVAAGGSVLPWAVSGRAAAGADVQLPRLRGVQLHLFGDLAWEHFFNPDRTHASDSLLLSLGVGWRP